MRATGNGNVEVCANNLLQMVRGEVPYERLKGLDPRLIDKNTSEAIPEIQQSAEWVIGIYEPRAEVVGIAVGQSDSVNGHFDVKANIKKKEG
jgi:hypothetical protein